MTTPRTDRIPRVPGATGREGRSLGLLDVFLALLVVGAVDLLLFHAGGYFDQLKPESYSGRLLESSDRLDEVRAGAGAGERLVLVVGDSTAKAAIDAASLTLGVDSEGYDVTAFNYSQPGSTSRSWQQLVRDERFDASSTALVVVGVLPTALRIFEEPKPDLEILKTELGWVESWVLSGSYPTLEERLFVRFGSFLRVLWFREDLRDYLEHPAQRRRELRARGGAGRPSETRRSVESTERSMTAVRLDREGRLSLSDLPPHLRERPDLHPDLERWLRNRRRPADERIEFDPRKLRMLERLVETMDERGVPVLIAILPKMKAVFRHREIDTLRETVVQLRREGRRVEWFEDSKILDLLEDPRYFVDHLHLNPSGAAIYTEALAKVVAAQVGSRASPAPIDGASRTEIEAGPGATD